MCIAKWSALRKANTNAGQVSFRDFILGSKGLSSLYISSWSTISRHLLFWSHNNCLNHIRMIFLSTMLWRAVILNLGYLLYMTDLSNCIYILAQFMTKLYPWPCCHLQCHTHTIEDCTQYWRRKSQPSCERLQCH